MIASNVMPEVPLEGSWIMNEDHSVAQNIVECNVVSMNGFGSYHCILQDDDGNEEARIIHGKDLHWMGDYWIEMQRPYKLELMPWDEKSYECTDLETQRVFGAIGDAGAMKSEETFEDFKKRALKSGLIAAKNNGASKNIIIKRVHEMRLNVEPEKIVSQILGDLINVEGTNEKLFSVFNSEYGRMVIPGQLRRTLLNEDKVQAFNLAVKNAWNELTDGKGIWWIVSDDEQLLACTDCCETIENCDCQ